MPVGLPSNCPVFVFLCVKTPCVGPLYLLGPPVSAQLVQCDKMVLVAAGLWLLNQSWATLRRAPPNIIFRAFRLHSFIHSCPLVRWSSRVLIHPISAKMRATLLNINMNIPVGPWTEYGSSFVRETEVFYKQQTMKVWLYGSQPCYAPRLCALTSSQMRQHSCLHSFMIKRGPCDRLTPGGKQIWQASVKYWSFTCL